ncbi:MAG: hypothetical protein DRJ41_02125 [Thermoprotei archaeon]|nr:MAG: hypothetical protein DRJ41_02125 [Thermoprotei archaeon]
MDARVNRGIDFEAISRIAGIVSRLGLGKSIATILATLIIKGPLTQDEIARITGYSISSVSTSLSFLERMGLVTIVKRVGRRGLYSVAGSLLELIERILESHVYRQLTLTVKFLEKNISRFNYRTRKNIERIIDEYARIRGRLRDALGS